MEPFSPGAEAARYDQLKSCGVPMEAVLLYARWWRLETWLRELTYIELRSKFGPAWLTYLTKRATDRQQRDSLHEYMVTSDATNALAYEDAGILLEVIGDNWPLFAPCLLDSKKRWEGRAEELLQIRHRVGHCRRPHADDVSRVEQTLRDLEPGAWKALASYNHLVLADHDLDDPVVEAWVRGNCADARRLLDHAQRQYDTSLHLRYSVRPWAVAKVPGAPITGTEGVLWHFDFVLGGRYLDPVRIGEDWRDPERLPPSIIHVLADTPYHPRFTMSALEDPAEVMSAIGRCFDSILECSQRGSWRYESDDDDYSRWHRTMRDVDHRVQTATPLAKVFPDYPRVPILLTTDPSW